MNTIARRVLRISGHVAQWGVVAFLAIACLGSALGASEFKAAGVDPSTYFLAIAGMAVVSVGLLPPLFFRLPLWGRVGAYALGLVAFVAVVWTSSTASEAYERTPKGAAEAATLKAEEAAQTERARQEASQKANRAVLAEAERDLADTRSRVQRCINWRGQIPALVRTVKEGMHNPRSFEHVRTEMRIVGSSGVPAVIMQYRGENGFGAIRTQAVSAFIAPSDCSVSAVKEYEANDFAD